MHARSRLSAIVLALQLLLISPTSHAMDLTHYDVDSLAYLSTDIVIATLSEDQEHQFTATVNEALYGSLHAGERIERLSPFLTFFRPLNDGMKVILFLDRRPHQYDFFHADAAKSPFAVPPSGVYLIDAYEHVHEYFQQNNPGPYVAQGYSFFLEVRVPTKEQDLALPTLSEKKAVIAASIKKVEGIRPLLDKVATRTDVPALFDLLDARQKTGSGCFYPEAGDAIAARIALQIRALQDPGLLLRLERYHVDPFSDVEFVKPQNGNRDPQFTSGRVQYLLKTISDQNQDGSLRIAAAGILAGLNRYHNGSQSSDPKPWLIDNEWLSPSATDIGSVAKTAFTDDAQNTQVRLICLRFLPLDDAQSIADIKAVYARSKSSELRFAIEDYLMEKSDQLYESLNPPGGPVASFVSKAPDTSCTKATPGNVAFLVKYREAKSFHDRWDGIAKKQIVLTSLWTHQRLVPADIHYLGGWSGVYDGEFSFELNRISSIPSGDYTLQFECIQDAQVLSTGYGVPISVVGAKHGDKIVVK